MRKDHGFGTEIFNKCFSSVQLLSCVLTFCDPMNRSTPGLPVHHQLPEFTQTHVHQVSDAIQPFHKLFSSVQSFSRVQLFATPRITTHQASLSITNSQSSPKLTSIKSVMPSSRLILCRPLLLLPSIFPSIRVFSNESVL